MPLGGVQWSLILENSKIEWTHHTFNAWEGCEKVSAGCANCYAEQRDRQYHGGSHWGSNGTRKMMSEGYWKQPLKWNVCRYQCSLCGAWNHPNSTICAKKGCLATENDFVIVKRPRVFCSSLADVFENRPELLEPRRRLFDLISDTPNLDWLLLTKRPENVLDNVPVKWLGDGFPDNVWLGASVENQEQADKRIPELLKIPAAVRFLSCEPLLGDVSFQRQIRGIEWNLLTGEQREGGFRSRPGRGIDWVIVGGESGTGAREFDIKWARSLQNQCADAGVAFFLKQLGANAIGNITSASVGPVALNKDGWLKDKKGGDWNEWPEDLRVRQMPTVGGA